MHVHRMLGGCEITEGALLKIDKNVPVPPMKGKPRTTVGKLVRDMQTGDSIPCESEQEKEAVRSCMVHVGYKYATRKVDGGWRVWRVG